MWPSFNSLDYQTILQKTQSPHDDEQLFIHGQYKIFLRIVVLVHYQTNSDVFNN